MSPLGREGPARRGDGKILAAVLRGSWRVPPVAGCADDALAVAEALVAARVGGIAWHRVAHSAAGPPPGGTAMERLRAAYATNALARARREAELRVLVPALAAAGIPVAMLKGWDLARRYPGAGMRSPGDLDLCVRPDNAERVRTVARGLGVPMLDLKHTSLARRPGGVAGVLRRARTVALGDVAVPVISEVDAMAVACLHVVQHGGRWPHMLCDVAVLVEAADPGLDWDGVLQGEAAARQWMVTSLVLARDLLGADVSSTPAAAAPPLSRWVVDSILGRWGAAHHLAPESLRRSGLGQVANGWVDPVTASFRTGRHPRSRRGWPRSVRYYLESHWRGVQHRARRRAG